MEPQKKIADLVQQSTDRLLSYAADGIGRMSFSDIMQRAKQELQVAYCKIAECIVAMAEMSFNETRDKHRIIVRNKNKKRTLLTELGEVEIRHTLYCDKVTRRYFFAADEILKLEKRSRIERSMKAKLVSDATITSYGKAAELANNSVSRQTVHNLVKSLKVIEAPCPKTNREIPNIYIEADEDHIHLNNGKPTEVKLVYVHEGRDNTNGRMELVNPRYFTSVRGDLKIWENVSEYLSSNYSDSQQLHLSGDGATWIKNGMFLASDIEFHLDKFHLQKALMKLSRGDIFLLRQLKDCAYEKDFERFNKICKENHISGRDLTKIKRYVLANIEYISDDNCCSAEGHVSHVLSARMSSRPMGWSRAGAERMAKLRAFLFNKGDFGLLFEEKNIRFCKKRTLVRPPKKLCNRATLPDNIADIEGKTYSIPGMERASFEFARKIKQILK